MNKTSFTVMMAIVAHSANSLITRQGKYLSATKTEAQKVAEIKQRMND